MAADRDVAVVAGPAQRDGQGQEIVRSPLKGQREADDIRRRGLPRNLIRQRGQVGLLVEGTNVRLDAGRFK